MATWPDILMRLSFDEDLNASDTAWMLDEVFSGRATDAQLGAFLMGMQTKGATAAEVNGMVQTMLAHAAPIAIPGRSVDIVGTGGDKANTVNISTMAAIVIAGAGLRVVKHGSKAASSTTGSSDVLGALGVNLDLEPERVAQVVDEVGITFCYAIKFHPAMRFAGPVRKELGIPTIFNVLGPLANPVQPTVSVIGASSEPLAPVIAEVLAMRGREGMVFRNNDGLDELAATSSTRVWVVRNGVVTESVIDAVEDLGLHPIPIEALRGGEFDENAAVVRSVLAGASGPVRETVIANAALAIAADGTLPGTDADDLLTRIRAGMVAAAHAIDSGAAEATLHRWAKATQS
ncbi:anthranilate phosphoribosyltransferase [Demequina sp. TTPB684]|uniref:anthranilate phosphoribosyltransferase n=1 Tax=unclassified Demequina TaxID=2620311 RepID=UPI001CF3C907|nr:MULTISPECIES: anthranilate phosphoribosyltransferase [unclassified Demequina]MCB2413841.1 anthranilate phosphoribosyltransferase [Demequina sp. TTPB684]UPU89153.1 anthranilate phosphoribosyltransferase [Demequina sp. TMPB413]